MQPLPHNARTAGIQEVYRRLAKYHGIPVVVASDRLHQLEDRLGLAPAAELLFDLTGNVYDPTTREWLGSLTEGGA